MNQMCLKCLEQQRSALVPTWGCSVCLWLLPQLLTPSSRSSQSEPLTGFQGVLVCKYESCLFTFSA